MSPENEKGVGRATLHDLCPEEKLKVGNLIRRLAEETQEKLNAQKKYEALLEEHEKLKEKYA